MELGAEYVNVARSDLYNLFKYVSKSNFERPVALEIKAHFRSGLIESSFGCDPKRVEFWFQNFQRILDICNPEILRESIREIDEMASDAFSIIE